jgi:hypothetical protein
MLEIQKVVLIKAIRLLNSIDVEYAILAGGEKHGTLELAVKKTKKGERSFSSKYGRGTILNYIRPYIDNLKVGEVVQIPTGEYNLEAVAATSASHSHRMFGNGGYTGRADKEKNVYEILRLEA